MSESDALLGDLLQGICRPGEPNVNSRPTNPEASDDRTDEPGFDDFGDSIFRIVLSERDQQIQRIMQSGKYDGEVVAFDDKGEMIDHAESLTKLREKLGDLGNYDIHSGR